MRVLVVGGSGYVASLILSTLAGRYAVRVFDRVPPPAAGTDFVAGDATDHAALVSALDGVDAVLHCVRGGLDETDPAAVAGSFAANVESVYTTLWAAHTAGVPHAVYVSSMSVYADLTERRIDDESVPADAVDLYGLTKRLGEQVCAAAAAKWGLSVNVLRLAWPTTDAAWPAWALEDPPVRVRNADGILFESTAASDLARAVSAALELRDGYQVFTVAGDRALRLWSTAKARERLGWEPTFGIRS